MRRRNRWLPPRRHDYISHHYAKERDAEEKRALKLDTLRGIEIVDATARLCAMNLFLHGIRPLPLLQLRRPTQAR